MKVKDLINELQKLNADLEIVVSTYDYVNCGWCDSVPEKIKIEKGKVVIY